MHVTAMTRQNRRGSFLVELGARAPIEIKRAGEAEKPAIIVQRSAVCQRFCRRSCLQSPGRYFENDNVAAAAKTGDENAVADRRLFQGERKPEQGLRRPEITSRFADPFA